MKPKKLIHPTDRRKFRRPRYHTPVSTSSLTCAGLFVSGFGGPPALRSSAILARIAATLVSASEVVAVAVAAVAVAVAVAVAAAGASAPVSRFAFASAIFA